MIITSTRISQTPACAMQRSRSAPTCYTGWGLRTTLNGNGVYTVPLSGSVLPSPTTALPVNEIGTVYDRRIFSGQYAQIDWKPDDRWDLLAGIRLNEAYEHKESSDLVLPPMLSAESVSKTMIRPSEPSA